MGTYNDNGKHRAIQQLDANKEAFARRLGREEAPWEPACETGFYDGAYLHDRIYIAWVRASHGQHRTAAAGLLGITDHQRTDGMIPNMVFPPQEYTFNPERWMFNQPFESSDYTQPPELAFGVHQVYKASKAIPAAAPEESIDSHLFLETIYPRTRLFYEYFINERQVAQDDPRVFIIHPHETGHDSRTDHDGHKVFPRIPRTGERTPTPINYYNIAADYLGTLGLNFLGWRKKWDPAQIKPHFAPIDLTFNIQLAVNYYEMATLAGYLGLDKDVHRFTELAQKLEEKIQEMYVPQNGNEKGAFYSFHKGNPILVKNIGTVMPVMLPNIRPELLQATLDVMDESFDTPFPLPTVATDDKARFDPHYEEANRHARGPTWIHNNKLAMRGLARQVSRDDLKQLLRDRSARWLNRLDKASQIMVANAYAEHYNPYTREPQRLHRTKGHALSIIADATFF